MPTAGSLFSGGGLLDCGLALAGWEHAWVCEADEFRRGLLRKRFPGAVVFDDVRTVRGQAAADSDRARTDAYTEGGEPRPTASERAMGAGESPCGCPWEYIDAGGFCARCHAHIDDPAGLYAKQPRREAPATAYTERGNGLTKLARGGVCGPGWWADSPGFASRVDLIALGFPCRGVSSAGKRQGFENAETVLWHEGRRVIGEIAPRYVIVENVAAILSMAASPGEPAGSLWGIVLSDLAALGFDVRWDVIPAAAVGAPHLRERVFAVGVRRGGGADAERTTGAGGELHAATADADGTRWASRRKPEHPEQEQQRHLAHEDTADAAADADAAHGQGHGSAFGVRAQVAGDHGEHPEPAADAAQARREPAERSRQQRGMGRDLGAGDAVAVDWGDYGPAIRRWEAIHGQAPAPLISRLRRLDARRADMPDVRPGLDRPRMRAQRQRLSALGDGVQVQVGRLVGEYVMSLIDDEQQAAA